MVYDLRVYDRTFGVKDTKWPFGKPTRCNIYSLPRVHVGRGRNRTDPSHPGWTPPSSTKEFRLSRRHPFKAALDQFNFEEYVKNVASVYNRKAAGARWGYECIRLPFILLPVLILVAIISILVFGALEISELFQIASHQNGVMIISWLFIIVGCLILVAIIALFYVTLCRSGHGPVKLLSKFQLWICKRYLEVCHKPHIFIQKLIPELRPELKRAILMHLAGSAADGYGFFPALAADIGLDCIQIFHQDIDLNVVYVNFTVHPEQLAQTGMPGYTRVRLQEDDRRLQSDKFIANCAKYCSATKSLYLSADYSLQSLADNLPSQPRVRSGHPTVKFSVPLECQRGNYHLDIDMAFALPLKPWPPEAREWIYRPRTGVSTSLIEKIVNEGALLVAKGCPASDCAHDLDWRLTFTQAEVKLFHHHAEDKKSLKLCYIILKFIIKTIHLDNRKIDLEEGVHLSSLKSYYLKTIYLWIAENPPEFCIRNPDMNRIFVFLVKQYQKALQAGIIPNYFLPKINMLAELDREAIRKGITCLRMIRKKRNVFIHRFQMLWFDRFSKDRWRGVLGEEDKRNPWNWCMHLLTLG